MPSSNESQVEPVLTFHEEALVGQRTLSPEVLFMAAASDV